MSADPSPRFLNRGTPPHIMTLVLLAGMSALAMNVFLPSLPNMAAWFDTEYRLMQLSVSVYLAMNAFLQLFIGTISDRFGRRPVLLWSIALFLLATVGTLLASTVEVFLFFRMCQAVIVAGMVLSRAVVRDMVGPERAASMIGYVTMGMAIVPMISPMIGGILDEAFGWQSTFILMLVCGLLTLALVWFDLGETATRSSTSFREQAREYPELLTSRRFWGYCATAAFGSGAFFAFLGGAPYVGMEIYGLSPTWLGIYFGAPAVGYALGNFLAGRFSVRYGINRMALTGTLVVSGGLFALLLIMLADLAGAEVFFGFFTLMGLGNGMLLPNATAGMLSVRPHLAGTASGLGGAIMIAGGAVLSALAAALLVPGAGAWPLIIIMLSTSVASVLSMLYVIHRARSLGE